MALSVKTAEVSAAKWATRAGGAQQEYQDRAVAAAAVWLLNAGRAQNTYQAAITVGNIAARWAAGIRRAGQEKYSRKVSAVGGQRYGAGVGAAQPDYQGGVGPFLQKLASLTLSQRQPRGSEANITRVREVATALHAERLARLGAATR